MMKYCIKMEGKYLAYRDLFSDLYPWDAVNFDQMIGKSWYWTNNNLLAKHFTNQADAHSFLNMKQGHFWRGAAIEKIGF